MSQHVWTIYIQLIIYIGFLNLGDSLPLIMYLFISITYENQKNKNTKNITKGRCLVAHVACDARSNYLQSGTAPGSPSPPLPSLLTLKDETANECSLLQKEKIN